MDVRLQDQVAAAPGEPGAALAQQRSSLVEEIDLREVLRKLWRRKGLIIGTVFLLTIAAAIGLLQITPRYTAQNLVLIETRGANVVDLEAVMAGLSSDMETVQSEIQVISSRRIAAKVVETLGLAESPEFNEDLNPPGLIETYLDPRALLPEAWLAAMGSGPAEIYSEEEIRAQRRAAIVDEYLERLSVYPMGRSRVIAIDFTSESPKLAASAANTIAELYILEQLEVKFEATQRATAWLNDHISGLREKVEFSERAVEEFRKASGLLKGTEGTLVSQEISELNTQLILARTARAEADARLKQVRALIRSSGGAASAAEVLESKLIQSLREQEAEVDRKVAELSEEYGERHPKMINARAELRDLRGKIENEVNKIVSGLANEVGVARARENTLQRSVNAMKATLAQSNTAEVQLRALQREANANRALLETFLARFKETSAQEDLDIQQPDARVISPADIPDEPSFPKVPIILALVVVASTFVGVMLVFVVETLDQGFRSGDQIEKATGVGVLTLVPALGGFGKKDPHEYIMDRPTSAFGESIRTLYTSLLLSHVDAPPKTIVVTSSQPNEGKTTLSVCLVRMLAKSGRKVVMVDGDLRNPSIGKFFGLPTEPGLVDMLAGEKTLEEVLHKDEFSGAHVLTAGKAVPNTADIVGSEHMKRLLEALGQTYDLVVIDSPPVLAVVDARVLSNAADAVVFSVRWADTRREMVVQGLKHILSAGGRIAGVALTMVDVKKHAQYGYGDSSYYYGRIKKYYVD